jgi:hypothetical protein
MEGDVVNVHKSLSLVSIFSQKNPVHILPNTATSILTACSYLDFGVLRGFFPTRSLTKILYPFLISHKHATCLTHCTVLDLVILISGGEYKL